ncbi:acyltransferase family protein [Rhizomicrobium electricum]|uniref:Acyltransferase n=1 Tax=Rhizomicrobium electricum TaxID=480070 RepID=A0ABP3PCZ7_9PROT|nr:acyltransferase family protein [Rhizomicrobium electricum]NIJ48646.1 peptidoglycan/LPS O-acetylase OafA/YrhL [Rhizomicrobium electricum]
MTAQPARRVDFIDNLRWVVIIFVVGVHAACSYSGVGGWYWHSPTQPDPVSQIALIAYEASLQAFFMGFLFFLAGYFVPTAYDHKGFVRFLRDRAFRLGLPALLYIFIIHIGTGYFLLGWYDKSGLSLAAAWWEYVSHPGWLNGTGPLWFAVALLAFCTIYAVFRLIVRRVPAAPANPTAPSLIAMLSIGVAVGAAAFLVRQVAPVGTSWHNMQFCFFPQYVVLFPLGILARRRGWIEALPARWGTPMLATAVIGAPISIAVLTVLNTMMHGSFADIAGGLTWAAAIYAFWEQIVCVLFCVGLLIVFRDRFNIRNRLTGFLSDNGFAVYVIHPPVLVAITLAMRPLQWPALGMFAFAWAAALVASFAAGALLRQVPGLKRIL